MCEWKATADKNRSRGIKQTSISSYACLLSQSLSHPPLLCSLHLPLPSPVSSFLPTPPLLHVSSLNTRAESQSRQETPFSYLSLFSLIRPQKIGLERWKKKTGEGLRVEEWKAWRGADLSGGWKATERQIIRDAWKRVNIKRRRREEEERRTNQVPNPDLIRFLEATAEIITSLRTPSEGQRHHPPSPDSFNQCPAGRLVKVPTPSLTSRFQLQIFEVFLFFFYWWGNTVRL